MKTEFIDTACRLLKEWRSDTKIFLRGIELIQSGVHHGISLIDRLCVPEDIQVLLQCRTLRRVQVLQCSGGLVHLQIEIQ